MTPVNVLHVIYQMSTGGAQRVLANLVNGSGPGFYHHIASVQPPDDFVRNITSPFCKVWTLGKKQGNDAGLPMKIRRIIRENDIEVVHALGWGVYAESLLAAKALGSPRPFVFAFRGKTLAEAQGVPLRRRVAQHFFSYLCDAIVAPSRLMGDDYAQEIAVPPGRVRVIYNGVGDLSLPPSARDGGEGGLTFGCVARLDKVKGVDLLLLAFARLAERYRDTRLLLVGDGEEREELWGLAAELGLNGRVEFCGSRSDIPQLLGQMDVYVQPSRYEGVSNSILEAMSMGKPIVATRVGGTPEIVEDRRDGILAEPSAEALAAAMEFLLLSPELRAGLGAAARECARRQFSIQVMVAAYEDLFRSLCGTKDGLCVE